MTDEIDHNLYKLPYKKHMDWSTQLASITKTPETVDEAVNRLMEVLDSEHKQEIATIKVDNLIDLHFSVGIAIRNAFGLHDQDSEILKSCGFLTHPDDASMIIIKALWKELTRE